MWCHLTFLSYSRQRGHMGVTRCYPVSFYGLKNIALYICQFLYDVNVIVNVTELNRECDNADVTRCCPVSSYWLKIVYISIMLTSLLTLQSYNTQRGHMGVTRFFPVSSDVLNRTNTDGTGNYLITIHLKTERLIYAYNGILEMWLLKTSTLILQKALVVVFC